MCIAVDNSKGKRIDSDILDRCVNINPDGFAFYNLKTKKLTKTMKKEDMRKLMDTTDPYLAHCRKATLGATTPENIHFFESGKWIIAMNGTIDGWADKKSNDTKNIIKIFEMIKNPKDVLKAAGMFEARFMFHNIETGKTYKTGEWVEENGVDYSKKNVLEKKTQWASGYGSYHGSDYTSSSNYNSSGSAEGYWAYKNSIWEFVPWKKKEQSTSTSLSKIPSKNNKTNKGIPEKYKAKIRLGVYGDLRDRDKEGTLTDTFKYIETGLTRGKYTVIKDGDCVYAVDALDYEKGINIPLDIYECTQEQFDKLNRMYGKIYNKISTTYYSSVIDPNKGNNCKVFFISKDKYKNDFDNIKHLTKLT